MRILVATGVYPPEGGGPATYSKLLEERLPAMGLKVKVLPFRLVRHLPKVFRHIAYFWAVFQVGKKADVIFAQDPVSVGLPAWFAAFLRRKVFILKMVGDYAWEQGRQRGGVKESLDDFQTTRHGVLVELMRFVERFVARRAKRVIVPSEYLAKIVRQWGVPAERISVIYNGVDFSEKPIVPRSRPSGKLIVTVSRLVPWKCIDAIIEVLGKEKEWSLVVAGEGPERAVLEKKVSEEGVRERVHFVGNVSHTEALGWMLTGDVFVLNSTYEGMSHVLLEAMHQGRPVVATDAGGNPEVVQDGESGLLVPVGNTEALRGALLRVLSDTALSRKLGSGARKRAADFSIDETVRKTGELLKKLAVSC